MLGPNKMQHSMAVLTEMCKEKNMDLAKHIIPTFSGRIGEDPRRDKRWEG